MKPIEAYYRRVCHALAKVVADNPPRSPAEAGTLCAAYVQCCAMNLAAARRIACTSADIIRAGDMIQDAIKRWEAEMAAKN